MNVKRIIKLRFNSTSSNLVTGVVFKLDSETSDMRHPVHCILCTPDYEGNLIGNRMFNSLT